MKAAILVALAASERHPAGEHRSRDAAEHRHPSTLPMLRVVSLMAEPTPVMAATSVYLHFDSIESLILAVAERLFGELVRQQDEAAAKIADPCQRVL